MYSKSMVLVVCMPGLVRSICSARPGNLARNSADTMNLLRDRGFQRLLEDYPRKKDAFIVAIGDNATVMNVCLFDQDTGAVAHADPHLADRGRLFGGDVGAHDVDDALGDAQFMHAAGLPRGPAAGRGPRPRAARPRPPAIAWSPST